MIVTLVGYRGSGKSTVAALLAERLGYAWRDADPEIERRAGRSIREIFATDGEPGFRKLERETLRDLLADANTVIAAGGGAILDERNRNDMRDAGPVVWLRADARLLTERIAGDETTAERRPSLTGTDVLTEIAGLLATREPLYRDAATLVVDTDDLSPEEIAQRIAHELSRTGTVAGERP